MQGGGFGRQKRIGDAIGDMQLVKEADDSGRELGDQIVGCEGAHFDSCALIGVGSVIETGRQECHADEACRRRSGQVADGDGATPGIGAIYEGKGEGVDEAGHEARTQAGIVSGIFAVDCGYSEVSHSASNVAGDFCAVVAAKGTGTVAPVMGIMAGGMGHGNTGFKGWKDESAWPDGRVNFKTETLAQRKPVGGLRGIRDGSFQQEIRCGGWWLLGDSRKAKA